MKIAKPNRLLFAIIVLLAIECSLAAGIGIWREYFWQAIADHNLKTFLYYLAIFIIAALGACFVNGYGGYLTNYLSLVKRYNLTRKAFKILNTHKAENLPQRVQEDCLKYYFLGYTLAINGIRSIVLTIIYSTILIWQLSLNVLIWLFLYVIVGTIIAAKIAKPLINLNYINQNVEAAFRQALTKTGYAIVHRNNMNLYTQSKYLQYFQSFFQQFTVVVPYLLLSPIYFTYKISFGVLMQCSASINTIVDSLSYLIISFNDINRFLSCRKRLKEIGLI